LSRKISILLPTYNGERYLSEQLDSILAQSLGDFELLIADDGSSDGTASINESYARSDERVRILPTQGNEGQKARLLQLLRHSSAPLVAFSDQDDVWHPSKLERLAFGIGDHSLAYGRSDLVDAAGRPLDRSLLASFGSAPDVGDKLYLLFMPRASAHALLVRREAVSEMAFLRLHHFDWLISLDAAFARGIVYVDDARVFHRIHGQNQVNGPVGDRRARLHKFRPDQLWSEWVNVRRNRFNFVERLEHLGHSPIIDPAVRRTLYDLAVRCRGAWFDSGVSRPFSNSPLRRYILEELKPLAGSDADWERAADHVKSLTSASAHPRNLYHTAKRLFYY
jgi:glycosyltransferase involved in cell wall biosynthesis